MNGRDRFTPASPWPDGQYYVWDKHRSSICNPDTGGAEGPYRRLSTPGAAIASAELLNKQPELGKEVNEELTTILLKNQISILKALNVLLWGVPTARTRSMMLEDTHVRIEESEKRLKP